MRIVNRPLAFVVAIALLAAGVLMVVEVIGYAINSTHVVCQLADVVPVG